MTAAERNETGNYLALLPVLDLNLEMRQSALPHGICTQCMKRYDQGSVKKERYHQYIYYINVSEGINQT